MRKVKYIGKADIYLGEFGKVKKGAILDMLEVVWEPIKKDERFKLITLDLTDSELEHYRSIMPQVTEGFDLTSIAWDNPKLFKMLVARYSKTSLMAILRALESIKGVVSTYDRYQDRRVLADNIYASVRIMGWHKLDMHKLGNEIRLAHKEKVEEARKKAEEERKKKEEEAILSEIHKELEEQDKLNVGLTVQRYLPEEEQERAVLTDGQKEETNKEEEEEVGEPKGQVATQEAPQEDTEDKNPKEESKQESISEEAEPNKVGKPARKRKARKQTNKK